MPSKLAMKKVPAQTKKNKSGKEKDMNPKPIYKHEKQKYKLKGKVTLITGGDSGIGRAIAVAYAQEGAKVVIVYNKETEDAKQTKAEVELENSECLLIKGDIKDENFCKKAVNHTIKEFGKLDILINNAAVQHMRDDLTEITKKDLLEVFKTNIFSIFYFVKYALPHLKKGGCIINTTSVTAYRGSEELVDYAATKGSIVALTRSLSGRLIEQGIRVNGVAPGPIWTPLIPSTFSKEKLKKFGTQVPMKRPGQPVEVAPSYVFLASDDASYITGQIIHPNGGELVSG